MDNTILCVHCHKDVSVDISRAYDEDGEVFICPHCGKMFRFCLK